MRKMRDGIFSLCLCYIYIKTNNKKEQKWYEKKRSQIKIFVRFLFVSASFDCVSSSSQLYGEQKKASQKISHTLLLTRRSKRHISLHKV